MKQHPYIADYGHCCNACKYYDVMSGYCSKTNEYHRGYDFTYGDGEPCPKWKIADDLKQSRPTKPKVEKVSLFKTEQITPRPEPHQVSVLDEETPSKKDESERKPF
jgi:hypothetical protein